MADWLRSQPCGFKEKPAGGQEKPLGGQQEQHLREQLIALMRNKSYTQSYVAKQLNTWPSYISIFVKQGKPFPKAVYPEFVKWMVSEGCEVQPPTNEDPFENESTPLVDTAEVLFKQEEIV